MVARRKVQIQYFAVLREERGLAVESYETQARTVADLYQELRARHSLSLPMERLRVAVNDEFCDWDSPVADSSRIVFIPPVAGG